MHRNFGAIALIYALRHETLPMYGGKSAAYDKIDSKVLPMKILCVRMDLCFWWKAEWQSAAYDIIDPKELPVIKLTQKICITS